MLKMMHYMTSLSDLFRLYAYCTNDFFLYLKINTSGVRRIFEGGGQEIWE